MARRKISVRREVYREIEKILRKCAAGHYIFRGEGKYFKEVSSNLYRYYVREMEGVYSQADPFAVLDLEKQTVENARRHFRPGTSNIEILAELQHHGGKTALIDFTRSIHVALFFACEESSGLWEENGRIICMNLETVRELKEIDYEEDCRDDAWIVPTGKNPRVVFQDSVFVHAPKGFVSSDGYETITIKKELKRDFLDYLEQYFHTTNDSVYNDIHGFIKHYQPTLLQRDEKMQLELDSDLNRR